MGYNMTFLDKIWAKLLASFETENRDHINENK